MRIRLCAVLPILFCLVSCGAFADSAADLKSATDLIAAKNYDEAIKLLGGVQSADPALAPQALELTGDCYRLKLDFAQATGAYEGVLSKYKVPSDQAARIRRELIKCHIRRQEWAKVEGEIDAAAAESPTYARWWYFALGWRYHRIQDFGKGVSAFDKAIEFDKDRPKDAFLKSARLGLVRCVIGAGGWDRAVELIKNLATDYPEDAAYWHECTGAVYQGQKKYPEAIAELKQAIDPASAVTARKRLGECYRDSLGPAAAAPLIMEIAEKHPKDGPYLPTVAGKLYQGLNDYDKAIAAFKFLISNCPDARWQVWDACYYIGECFYAQGKGDEALAYIKDFYAKHPDRPVDFAIAYGKTLLYPAKNPAAAAEVLAKAIAEHPQDQLVSEVRPMLIAAYADSKQIDRLADVLGSLAADASASEKPRLLLSLVDHYIAARKFREAASMCRGVLGLRDSTKDARAHAEYQLGLCYRSSNMDGAARHAMRNVAKQYPDSEWAKQARGTLYVWDKYGVPHRPR